MIFPRSLRHCCSLLFLALAPPFFGASTLHSEDAVDRMKWDRLKRQHETIADLRKSRCVPKTDRPFQDYRANLHVHSAFSHDSRGKIEQIVESAKKAGTKILMFNEHPASHYDFFVDGHQGMREGLLLVPGAESRGFLVFPKQSIQAFDGAEKQEFSNIIRGRGGLTFVSHLEERMDWEIQGVTGCEIYNTHADFKGESRLLASLKNPLWLIQAKKMFDTYPQEALSALLDYPADYLKRWDELCLMHPHTGVSANDAHQNVGLVLRLIEGNKVRVEDPLGEKFLELDKGVFAAIQAIPEGTAIGTELFRMQLDPYENSLRHVGTHLLMRDLTIESVWDSLESGRAFVAFDWMADSTGFDMAIREGEKRLEMGSQDAWKPGMKLEATAPHSVHWRIVKSGKIIQEGMGDRIDFAVDGPGNYRTEAWLNLHDQNSPSENSEQIWILSNPIYLK